MRKSSRYAAYLPFVLVAVIGLVYHVGMKPMAGDDIFFRDATKDTTLWAYLTQRYLTWTSRVVSECVLVNVIQFPVLWRIIDFLLFATLASSAVRAFRRWEDDELVRGSGNSFISVS